MSARTPTRPDLLKSYTLTSAYRILCAVEGFRQSHGSWPTRVLMDRGMCGALPEHVLTPLAWALLEKKLEIVAIEEGTLIAEGPDGTRYEYSDTDVQPDAATRACIWIWGVDLVN